MNNPFFVSLDVGYFSLKAVASYMQQKDSMCFSFPSIAVPFNNKLDLKSVIQRDEIFVSLNDKYYAVGNDAYLRQTAHESRILSENYITRPEYHAIALAALHRIGKKKIDYLALGTPMHAYTRSNISRLRETFKGLHQLPEGKTVDVREVLIIPQPVGGLVHYGVEYANFDAINNKTNLIIDPGGQTLDWAVANGIKPAIPRCGSFSGGGINTVINSIIRQIREKYGVNYTVRNRLEKDIVSGFVTVNGRQEPLRDYIETAMSELTPAFNTLTNHNDGHDIDNIVLVGGGAPLYEKKIQSLYPHHKVLSVPQPYLANARGFHILLQQYYRQSIGGAA